MKLLLTASLAAFVLIGSAVYTGPLRALQHKRDVIAAQEIERLAVIDLCAQQDASAFQHVASHRFVCVGGSRRITAPMQNPLESP